MGSFLVGKSIIEIINTLLVSLCVTLVFLAIFVDFALHNTKGQAIKEKKSIVETGTMTLFFLGYYLLLQSGIGRGLVLGKFLERDSFLVNLLTVMGWIPLVFGCVMNIWGRLVLGNNWANHIKIYNHHTFIQKGPYQWVRHPLYGSIIMMLLSGGLIYQDLLLILLTLIIFVPMMTYRANQEEALLTKEFEKYKEYQKQVGQLFIRISLKKREGEGH